MTLIVESEQGASGRFVNLGSASVLDDIGPQTVIAYGSLAANPPALAYLFGKATSASFNRFLVTTTGALAFARDSSSAANMPERISAAGAVNVTGTAQHWQADWDGGLLAAGINLYIDADPAITGGTSNNGVGTLNSDAATDFFLMNRVGLGRDFPGKLFYLAVWNRILTTLERAMVRGSGPRTISTGLVLCYANRQDYSTYLHAVAGRSTFVDGGVPPNTALGDPEPWACAMSARVFASASLPAGNVPFSCAMTQRAFAAASLPAEYVLSDAYERSSVNLAGCYVVGSGDAAIIYVDPKVTAGTNGIAHMNFGLDISGLLGKRPTIRILRKSQHNFSGVWHTTRRIMMSADGGLTSTYFGADPVIDVGNDWVDYRHPTAFTQDTMRITENRQRTVHQIGTWLQNLASTYSFVQPTTTAVAWTPTGSVSGYDAQSFIGNEFPSDVDSLGVSCGVTPFYCGQINDTSLMPYNGVKKVAMIHGGRHAGEDMGDVSMQQTIEWICGNSHEARELRRHFRILIYPMCTPQGRATGGYRGTTNGQDPNRLFNSTGTMLAVDYTKAAEVTDRAGGIPSWFISYHGTYQGLRELTASGNAADTVYLNKVVAISGMSVTDLGGQPNDRDCGWYHGVGYIVSTVAEHGDYIPMTDADLTTFALALGKGFAAMTADGQFDGFSCAMTARAAAAASLPAAVAPFTCAMSQSARAAANVITQIRMQAAMTLRATTSATLSSPSLTYYRASRAYSVPAISRRYAVAAPEAA